MFNIRDKFEKNARLHQKNCRSQIPDGNLLQDVKSSTKKKQKNTTINPPLVEDRFQLLVVFGFSKLSY